MVVEIRNKNFQKTYLNVIKIISYRHTDCLEFIGEQGETLDRIIPDKDTEVYVRDKDDAVEGDTCKEGNK